MLGMLDLLYFVKVRDAVDETDECAATVMEEWDNAPAQVNAAIMKPDDLML